MTRFLVDMHHADLLESHHMVYVDRFGWDLFIPYGLEWFTEDYWAFEKEWHGDAVARQYLVGIWEGAEPDANGIVQLVDKRHPGRTIRGITLAAAKDTRWDYVMSSVPSNAEGFSRLAQDTGAAWLIHVGNQWGDEAWDQKPAGAILTTTSVVPPDIPYVVVHQEFSLRDFHDDLPGYFGPIRSFVNCFPEMESEYQGNFVPLAQSLPEFRWQVFGAYGTAPLDEYAAGNIGATRLEGDAMRGAGVIWHAKHWSDGFGHVIHRAFAVGRPVFGYERYYRDKLAGPLWIEGVTSFDVESKSRDEVAIALRRLRDDPATYLEMCLASAARFREVVSFDDDAEAIRGLLERVREAVPT